VNEDALAHWGLLRQRQEKNIYLIKNSKIAVQKSNKFFENLRR
jgi:hypothetical protein